MKTNILFLLLFFCLSTIAQDTLVKTNRSKIPCKIEEIGQLEIKYRKPDNPDGPLYSIYKREITKIIFANGIVEAITLDPLTVSNGNKRYCKRAITTRPMSMTLGSFSLGYQKAFSPTKSIICELGLIFPKNGQFFNNNDASGGFATFGIRFKRAPEYYSPGMEWGYNMGGFYFQPELVLSASNRSYINYDWAYYSPLPNRTGTFTSAGVLFNVGRQMVFGDALTVDLSAGIGYAGKDTPKNSYVSQYYSHIATGDALAFKFGFSVGYLLR